MEKKNGIPTGAILGLVFIFTFISLITFALIQEHLERKYCKGVYPPRTNEQPIFEKDYGKTYGISKGYIECCRHYYEEYRREKECKVFPYN